MKELAKVLYTLIGGAVCVGSIWGMVWGITQVMGNEAGILYAIGIGIVALFATGFGGLIMLGNAIE